LRNFSLSKGDATNDLKKKGISSRGGLSKTDPWIAFPILSNNN
jgi:hypothetical protein